MRVFLQRNIMGCAICSCYVWGYLRQRLCPCACEHTPRAGCASQDLVRLLHPLQRVPMSRNQFPSAILKTYLKRVV